MSYASFSAREAFKAALADQVTAEAITELEAGFLLDIFDVCAHWGLNIAGLDAEESTDPGVPLVTLAPYDDDELLKLAAVEYPA